MKKIYFDISKKIGVEEYVLYATNKLHSKVLYVIGIYSSYEEAEKAKNKLVKGV